jgi:hypothetical protein
MGIRGCGFEQPLEAMRLALDRMNDPGDDAYGFADEGITAVVLVTDEEDCSHNPAAESIFLPEGSRVFWSLPEAETPSSAVCWNAGVVCSGLTNGIYGECVATDRDPVTGEVVPDSEAPARAALFPTSRYVARLGSEIRAYGIVGVPEGYPATPLQYRAAPDGTPNDPNYELNYGIGPGCLSPTNEAVPPVRLRAVIEASASMVPLQSICADSYDDALRAIAEDLVAALDDP